MRRAANPNLEIMEIAVARLGALAEEGSQARVPIIIQRLKAIAGSKVITQSKTF